MFGLSAVSQMMAQDAVFSPPIGRNQQIPRCLRIPTMPSGHTELEASTCSDLMPSTVLM
jgi:hypothetical protein